jgi:hydroxyethylthiazole kinase
MLSAMTAAYLVANPEQPQKAVAAAVCAMGLCGERAHARLGERDGNGTYRALILDEICNLSGDELETGARYEMR